MCCYTFFNVSFPAWSIDYGIPSNNLPRNPPDCIILGNCVFENFILANEPLAKALQIFETCVSVNNNLCQKLVSSVELQIKFD